LKTARKVGKVNGINLVDETSELMVISQFGKVIRIDTKSIRAAGRSTQGVKLLDLEPQDKMAAVVIPQKNPKPNPSKGTLLQQ
jgi:DNA gyrase subunit A